MTERGAKASASLEELSSALMEEEEVPSVEEERGPSSEEELSETLLEEASIEDDWKDESEDTSVGPHEERRKRAITPNEGKRMASLLSRP